MAHNFVISKTRLSNNPTKTYWECKFCDSGVVIPNRYTQHEVNQFMESKMPCIPPIITPLDEVIDNRTKIVKKPSKIYTGN